MELLPVAVSAAAIALVGLVGWLIYRYLAELMLIHRGTTTRGKVVSAIALGNTHGGSMFIVSYEFSTISNGGKASIYRGRQVMTYGFQPKDMVAVRFLPKWPRISLIADRAV
jgi:hypothetical protein